MFEPIRPGFRKAAGFDKQAERFFRLGLSMNADDSGLLFALGRLALARGEGERAKTFLQRALRQYPACDEKGETIDFLYLLEQPDILSCCTNPRAEVDPKVVSPRANAFYKECRLRSRWKRMNPLVIYDLADYCITRSCMGMNRQGKER